MKNVVVCISQAYAISFFIPTATDAGNIKKSGLIFGAQQCTYAKPCLNRECTFLMIYVK